MKEVPQEDFFKSQLNLPRPLGLGRFSIKTKPSDISLFFNMVRQAIELSENVCNAFDPPRGRARRRKRRPCKAATRSSIIAKALSPADLGAAALFKTIKFAKAIADNSGPGKAKLPHLNLLSLTGHGSGASAEWNSKTGHTSGWLIAMFSAMQSLAIARRIEKGADEAAEFRDKGGAGGDEPACGKASKKMAAAEILGSRSLAIAEDLAVFFLTVRQLYKAGQPETKGILIENKDSCVDISPRLSRPPGPRAARWSWSPPRTSWPTPLEVALSRAVFPTSSSSPKTGASRKTLEKPARSSSAPTSLSAPWRA